MDKTPCLLSTIMICWDAQTHFWLILFIFFSLLTSPFFPMFLFVKRNLIFLKYFPNTNLWLSACWFPALPLLSPSSVECWVLSTTAPGTVWSQAGVAWINTPGVKHLFRQLIRNNKAIYLTNRKILEGGTMSSKLKALREFCSTWNHEMFIKF